VTFQGGNKLLNSDQDLQEQGVSPENGEEVTAETEGPLEEETEVIEEAEDAKADLEAEFNNLQQRFLRLTADFDNYRRRTRQENAEIRRTAKQTNDKSRTEIRCPSCGLCLNLRYIEFPP
jgi:molecular chaperone GrpE (heat shock protein)